MRRTCQVKLNPVVKFLNLLGTPGDIGSLGKRDGDGPAQLRCFRTHTQYFSLAHMVCSRST